MMGVKQLPVHVPLPADWREQADRREQQDRDAELEARDRLVASHCSRFRKDGRHHLIRDGRPVFLHVQGELDVYTAMHCDGVAPTVPGTRWTNVKCPVFEIDGERYPPRAGRTPKARRKRILRRRPA